MNALPETVTPEEPKAPLKIDLGCGIRPREGFIGIDVRDFGQAITADLNQRWPWEDDSVDEAHSQHFVEHLVPKDRIHFINELWRVLKLDAKATIITPHWNSIRAYGDLSHAWPPVCEFWFYYLNKEWRKLNCPHQDGPPDGYTCNFDATWGYAMHPTITLRAQEYQQYAMANYKESIQDIHATLVKKEIKDASK